MRYLSNCVQEYRKQAIGFAFFLAWIYFSFFSCGLIPIFRISRSGERCWAVSGLCAALTAIIIILFALKGRLPVGKKTGLVASICSATGTMLIWAGFFSEELCRVVSALGAGMAGIGLSVMVLVWINKMSKLNAELIEFSVTVSFILAFFMYFVLLVFKGLLSVIFDALLPAVSMLFAFRPADLEDTTLPELPAADKPFRELRSFSAKIATLCLLVGMLWFQFSYFRVLSAPKVAGGRFLYYLVPFSSASILSVIAFILCIKLSRYLDFTLMFRWGLPFLLLSYTLLFFDYNNQVQRIIAYTVNFIGMFGVQLSFWIAVPKYLWRSGESSYFLFGGLMAAEGLGIFIGTSYGLLVIKSVAETNVMQMSLVFFVILLFVVMIVGFNPDWSFFRGRWHPASHTDKSGVQQSEELAVDDVTLLFRHRADELCRVFGLTARETEIAALLLAGRSRPYIRDELFISLNTVHSHVSNIYAKCGVHSQREFMNFMEKRDVLK